MGSASSLATHVGANPVPRLPVAHFQGKLGNAAKAVMISVHQPPKKVTLLALRGKRGRKPSPGEAFELRGVLGDLGGDHVVAGLGDEHVVLDADADTAIAS